MRRPFCELCKYILSDPNKINFLLLQFKIKLTIEIITNLKIYLTCYSNHQYQYLKVFGDCSRINPGLWGWQAGSVYPGSTTDHKINTFNIYNIDNDWYLINCLKIILFMIYFFLNHHLLIIANDFEIFTTIIQFLGGIHIKMFKIKAQKNFTNHLNLLMLKLVAILPYLNLISMQIFQGIFMYIFDEVNLLLNYQNLIKFF